MATPIKTRPTEPAPSEFMDNGCGPTKFGWLIPEFWFSGCCRQHDWEYLLGGTEEDREYADGNFLMCMLNRVDQLSWWKRLLVEKTVIKLAYVYFEGVRFGGKYVWNYRDSRKPNTMEEK